MPASSLNFSWVGLAPSPAFQKIESVIYPCPALASCRSECRTIRKEKNLTFTSAQASSAPVSTAPSSKFGVRNPRIFRSPYPGFRYPISFAHGIRESSARCRATGGRSKKDIDYDEYINPANEEPPEVSWDEDEPVQSTRISQAADQLRTRRERIEVEVRE